LGARGSGLGPFSHPLQGEIRRLGRQDPRHGGKPLFHFLDFVLAGVSREVEIQHGECQRNQDEGATEELAENRAAENHADLGQKD
jgi:hypothetical protein